MPRPTWQGRGPSNLAPASRVSVTVSKYVNILGKKKTKKPETAEQKKKHPTHHTSLTASKLCSRFVCLASSLGPAVSAFTFP